MILAHELLSGADLHILERLLEKHERNQKGFLANLNSRLSKSKSILM
jgi:hypothetical protein